MCAKCLTFPPVPPAPFPLRLFIYNNVYVVYVLDLRQQQRENALNLKIFPQNSCVVQKKCVPLHSLLRTTVLLKEADGPL